MSKTSLRSIQSAGRSSSQRRRYATFSICPSRPYYNCHDHAYRKTQEVDALKPFDFCCSVKDFDPLTKYDQRIPPFVSSLTEITSVHECPILKFRTEYCDGQGAQRRMMRSMSTGDLSSWKPGQPLGQRRGYGPGDGVGRGKGYGKGYEQGSGQEYEREYWQRYGQGHGQEYGRFGQEYDEDYTPRHGPCSVPRGPLKWFLEDEIMLAKDIFWDERRMIHEAETKRNLAIARKKVEFKIRQGRRPNWYYDFSSNQLQHLLILERVMQADYEDILTVRTQKALIAVGIITTEFRIKPNVIRRLQRSTKLNAIEFLMEIYKLLTGHQFEDGTNKKLYDSNEKILLSGIAFLTLPETVVELHKRLPPVKMPKIPPEPVFPQMVMKASITSLSEDVFERPHWGSYQAQKKVWDKFLKGVSFPKVYLPPERTIYVSMLNVKLKRSSIRLSSIKRSSIRNSVPTENSEPVDGTDPSAEKRKSKERSGLEDGSRRVTLEDRRSTLEDRRSTQETRKSTEESRRSTQESRGSTQEKKRRKGDDRKGKPDGRGSTLEDQKQKESLDKSDGTEDYPFVFDIPRLPDENKKFSFTLSGLGQEPGPVQYKICGTLNPPRENKKSWLGEKDAHYVISGVSADPPKCPVTYEMTGVANVTPSNSNERFFAVFKVGEGDKKIYPSGRKNLSRNWQEWLQNADEEYKTVEREANKIIKSIEATMRLVFPGPTCDSCCSCRQTRKTHFKMKESKTPYLVVDTVAEDDDNHKYIVGSMAMHSPAPSPTESAVNLIEVIASEDKIVNNVVISGVTNEQGKTQYYISGHNKNSVHVPSRTIELPPPLPPRNVPPCACAVHQMFNKGIDPTMSSDNIPWTKDEGLCFGKKYRPREQPAYSCKKYPGDKSCRRNPFMKDIARVKRKRQYDIDRAIEMEKRQRDDYVPEKKKMYSIADFKPCGDEHGMGLCGGPWGTLNLFSPQELEEMERQRKEILKGPPCGTKPGRAVCEGPFGEKIPIPSRRSTTKGSRSDMVEGEVPPDEDEDETDESEEESIKPEPEKPKERPKYRGKTCYASPEIQAAEAKKIEEKKKAKRFIQDPNYPGYDDPWNIFRTAPSKLKTKTDYENNLKLSKPKRLTSEDFDMETQRSVMQLRAVSSKLSKIADKSMERIIRKDKIDAIERFEKMAKIETIPRTVKTGKKSEKVAKFAPTGKIEQSSKPAKPAKTEQTEKTEMTEMTEKTEKTDKTEKIEKTEKTENTKKTDKAAKTGKIGLTSKIIKNQQPPRKGSAQSDESKNRTSSTSSASSKKRTSSSSSAGGKKQQHSDTPAGGITSKVSTKDATPPEGSSKRQKGTPATTKASAPSGTSAAKTSGTQNKTTKTIIKPDRPKSGIKGTVLKKPESKSPDREVGSFEKPRQGSRSIPSSSSGNLDKIIRPKGKKSQKASKSRSRSRKRDDRTRKRSVEIRRIHPDPDPEELARKKEAEKMTPEKFALQVQPALLPHEPAPKCRPPSEDMSSESAHSESHPVEEEVARPSARGPCGWRTKSEQELPTKKTLAFLTEPGYPLEEIPVRPGGRACRCRENRNKKKVLKYEIGGHIEKRKLEGKNVRKLLPKKDEGVEQRRVLDGVMYFTPPPSPRRSEEYVPEYEIATSPYDMCLKDRKDAFLKLMERYTLPTGKPLKSLRAQTCGCEDIMNTYGVVGVDQANEGTIALPASQDAELGMDAMSFANLKEQMFDVKTPRERWSIALKDVALVDYFTRCRDNVPCWLKCTKYDQAGCPINAPKLVIRRPVCECKYERKILEQRDEERRWTERQQRLKTYKKQPLKNIEDISRPIVPDTKLMISGVQRIPREDEYIDDVKYLITGVSENYTMSEPAPVVSVNLVTPGVTPVPSIQDVACKCLHRHWSETNLPPGPLPLKEAIEKQELQKRKEAVDEAFRQIYAKRESEENMLVGYVGCQGACEPVKVKGRKLSKGRKGSSSDSGRKRKRNKSSERESGDSTQDKVMREESRDSGVDEKAKSTEKRGQKRRKVGHAKAEEPASETIDAQDTEGTISKMEAKEDKKDAAKATRTRVSVSEKVETIPATDTRKSSTDKSGLAKQRLSDKVESVHVTDARKSSADKERQSKQRVSDKVESVSETDARKSSTDKQEQFKQGVSEKTESQEAEIAVSRKEDKLYRKNPLKVMKNILKEMAEEGFAFAKLSDCYLMPELKLWLMYRIGDSSLHRDKKQSPQTLLSIWNMLCALQQPINVTLDFVRRKHDYDLW